MVSINEEIIDENFHIISFKLINKLLRSMKLYGKLLLYHRDDLYLWVKLRDDLKV